MLKEKEKTKQRAAAKGNSPSTLPFGGQVKDLEEIMSVLKGNWTEMSAEESLFHPTMSSLCQQQLGRHGSSEATGQPSGKELFPSLASQHLCAVSPRWLTSVMAASLAAKPSQLTPGGRSPRHGSGSRS